MKLKRHQDAFGQELMSFLRGEGTVEIVERDDGHIDVADTAGYFLPPARWPTHQKRAVREVRGRVLDVGVGAGRWALHLQEKGHDVLGIDVSPLALEVCRRRGVRKVRLLSIADVTPKLGTFDTILMMGNNFGLFGSPARARRLLKRFLRVTSPTGRIVAECTDPYRTKEPLHLRYHARNRRRGRWGGQLRLRVRRHTYATPWFDYLFVSPAELKSILAGTGWRLARRIAGAGAGYIAVIEKERLCRS